ncbi:MAG: IS110 family transposase [Bryobacteraceae bacterium]|jgi:transposase
MTRTIAGIDIHKRVLMVVVATVMEKEVDGGLEQQIEYEGRRFGSGASEREHLVAWLRERQAEEVVMESTAQYWKPVWMDLELHFPKLHLAQARSNQAPKGRKNDFANARRLTRRMAAGELILSFVPDAEQRTWRTMTRGKQQLVRDRVRLQNQTEALLEEMRIKLSGVVSDLFGVSGRRILEALAGGETDPEKLADLGDDRLKCGRQALVDALTGRGEPMHVQILRLSMERLKLLDRQIETLDQMAAGALKKHADAVTRLAEVPGFGVDSAQQVIAEIGSDAKTFSQAGDLASWVGTIPGSDVSAERNHSSRSPKGNKFLRRIFAQAAQAAVRKKGCHFQNVFRRLLPKLGYNGAIWAIANRLCRLAWKILHDGVSYVEQAAETNPQAKKRRAQKLAQALRKLGYQVLITPIAPTAGAATQG